MAGLVLGINRGLELFWLIAVFLVPLAFLDRDSISSEAVIAYVEVPKIALLRILAGLMAILWLLEWAIESRLDFGHLLRDARRVPRAAEWPGKVGAWLRDRPIRWLFLAVWFFLGSTLLSTVFSGSFNVSMWGEIPGQDGYSLYTVASYVLLFGVIATHLKTRPQLWRLLGAVAAMGVLVAGYSISQHYSHDFLGLTERTGG